MSPDICLVDRCKRPRHPNWGICGPCAFDLERDLGDIPALVDELDLTISRQVAGGSRNGSRSTTKPLPFNYGASEAMFGLRNTLVGWIRDLEPEPGPGRDWPQDRAPAMARWLLARIDQLRTHPAAEEAVGEITAAVGECWRAIDRRAEQVYAGPCGRGGCVEGLYALPGRGEVRCRECGAEHDVRDRRDAMRAELRGRLYTAAEVARLAAYLGDVSDRERTRKLIDKWVGRGLVLAHGVDLRGRATYPFGELLDMLSAANERRTG